MLTLDHIAVAGETLEAARDHVETALGVALSPGGQHARYGTHNMLMGLADGLYLEAIAIDPLAPEPAHARWFDLDRFAGPPRIGNWICRCEDLDAAVAALPGAGRPVSLSRGALRWRMAVPDSGQLPFDNRFPALMQWLTRPTPAEALAVSGCRLMELVIYHPRAEALKAEIAPHLTDARVVIEVGPPRITAQIETPSGRRNLE